MSRIIIFANGDLPDVTKARRLVRSTDLVLCADGGSRHAFALGLQPHRILGDLDSIRDDDRGRVQAANIPVSQYARDKDETDLELTLRYALEQKPSAILIIAALGKRLDHTIGNVALLSNPKLGSLDVRLDDGIEEVFFCRQQASIEGTAGDIVSLIPWRGAVDGVRTLGLKWPLHGETLHAEKTRGISNEMLDATATVTISAGLLLVIHRRLQPDEENKS